MIDDPGKFDLKSVKISIQRAVLDCSIRGLSHTTKWLSELNFSLKDVLVDPTERVHTDPAVFGDEYDTYFMAKSYFDVKEYDRCAHYTERSTTPICRFLHAYSKYLSLEKKKIEDMTDDWPDPRINSKLQSLCQDLRADYLDWKLDSYMLYLYGVVLKRRDLHNEAIQVLVEAIHKEPLHWGAWIELATLIPDRAKLKSLLLPDHWIKQFFLAHTYLEQQLNDEALDIYSQLQTQGFDQSNYLLAQTAVAYHNKRNVVKAISTFHELRKLDPLRLDNMDIFSNLLYVKEMKVELAYLAHHATEIDKYRVETCCVIGNYYSLRTEHQKAVLYFQRALRLNPQYLSAWTLMGHEYMEMKNTNAAIQSYRQAIEVNRRDYRAWYGLGQTYEILKLTNYCLYYYKQAQQLRPNDSRMLVALGETYEKLEKVQEAIKCFYKARSVGDVEGVAIFKLAKLYEKVLMHEQALTAYTEFVKEVQQTTTSDMKSDLAHAYKYLTVQHLKNNNLDLAHQYAQKCLMFEETKEEGKSFLKTIAMRRAQQGEEGGMQVEENSSRQRIRNPEFYSPVRSLVFSTPENNT
ncbi:cell division cycle protein 23 homolog [Macrosteles quadrilineatus]|uniref:cell division cycle protein 23 homolog n=1 Tax=Macrosteles quadrilineatus TaxID=74068 RepID=UPI0023E0D9EF|nr:cell division cycle protein 23 homolog [Macrosteles quadrilineatus]